MVKFQVILQKHKGWKRKLSWVLLQLNTFTENILTNKKQSTDWANIVVKQIDYKWPVSTLYKGKIPKRKFKNEQKIGTFVNIKGCMQVKITTLLIGDCQFKKNLLSTYSEIPNLIVQTLRQVTKISHSLYLEGNMIRIL